MSMKTNGLLMKYFVLNPHKQDEYGAASRAAIMAYAEVISMRNPDLAKDLRRWMKKLAKEDAAGVRP